MSKYYKCNEKCPLNYDEQYYKCDCKCVDECIFKVCKDGIYVYDWDCEKWRIQEQKKLEEICVGKFQKITVGELMLEIM